jgi:VIT1/CCC1 family predicted Fe2+/Mn2+ transporter
VTLNAPAVLSLIATAAAFVAFLLMLQESIALGQGRDPMTNAIRAFARRYPSVTFVVAVLIGMLLGHLFWT